MRVDAHMERDKHKKNRICKRSTKNMQNVARKICKIPIVAQAQATKAHVRRQAQRRQENPPNRTKPKTQRKWRHAGTCSAKVCPLLQEVLLLSEVRRIMLSLRASQSLITLQTQASSGIGVCRQMLYMIWASRGPST